MPFSFCLIALALTSSMVLDNNGESRHSCLLPELRGKVYYLCSGHSFQFIVC